VIFLEEATQLSERAFQYLQTCIRGANEFPKRMYLTCNPGGVGHLWVKRLFIDKDYRVDPENPERTENPADYTFIFATVDDNPWVLKSSPMYLKNLANLPEDLRMAHRYGNWDALGGSYFKQFSANLHVFPHFTIPKSWPVYRSFDYGFDMFALCWFAVDQDGRSWCFREIEKKGLVVQDAAKSALMNTLPDENVLVTYAPPDMWNRQKDNGKTLAELFAMYGLPVVRADNNRVQGHMVMKDMLQPIPLKDPFVKSLFKEGEAPEKLPALMFFDTVSKVISDISAIQADDKNPNDCSKQPHEVTHTVDAVRYYCINRVVKPEPEKEPEYEDEDDHDEDYETFMCGDEITDEYMNF
jgi:phage terminase large subunit